MKNVFKGTTLFLSAIIVMNSCKDKDEQKPVYPGEKEFSISSAWHCDDGNCMDVFELNFIKGSKVKFFLKDVTGSSIGQIALYNSSNQSGGTNLLTGNTSEVTCFSGNDCDNGADGFETSPFVVPATGTFKLAITRNYGLSCGSTGTFRMDIASDINFEFKGHVIDDQISEAPDEPQLICGN